MSFSKYRHVKLHLSISILDYKNFSWNLSLVCLVLRKVMTLFVQSLNGLVKRHMFIDSKNTLDAMNIDRLWQRWYEHWDRVINRPIQFFERLTQCLALITTCSSSIRVEHLNLQNSYLLYINKLILKKIYNIKFLIFYLISFKFFNNLRSKSTLLNHLILYIIYI